MENDLMQKLKKRMDKTIQALQEELLIVRDGRANPAILDGIYIDYYGSKTPLNQLSNISAPEPQLITITPWEKKMIPEIEKAILKSNIGITPQNDGNIVRLPIPHLTEERRKELVKQVKQISESCKTSIRNIRRDGNQEIEAMEKNKEISETENHKFKQKTQNLTDEYTAIIEQAFKKKQKELLEF